MAAPVRAYIGLAANLGDSAATLRSVLAELAATDGIIAVTASPFYRTAPVDATGPDFVNAVAALAIGIAVGLGFGFLNGVFVAFAGMPPIIVTLATMGIARGLALIYTGGYPIDGLPDWVAFFGSGKVLGIQATVLIMLVVYAIAWLLLERMPFGR
ncbi:2-amino-4-hydroxy-6-hydroxymethyldihydropteridine diphosphokinase, partial [Enterobacter sp. DRP3]|nr:2-amino-4-hydroxy-6-hydroxymethyldihydropteridine diphosphokinase [Enterobacter sp. DRP3]